MNKGSLICLICVSSIGPLFKYYDWISSGVGPWSKELTSCLILDYVYVCIGSQFIFSWVYWHKRGILSSFLHTTNSYSATINTDPKYFVQKQTLMHFLLVFKNVGSNAYLFELLFYWIRGSKSYFGIVLDFFFLKFIYSEKATKFCEISTVDLTVTT